MFTTAHPDIGGLETRVRVRLTGFEGQSGLRAEGNQWDTFAQVLQDHGLSVVREPFGAKVDALIAMNHSDTAMREAKTNGVPVDKRLLVAWEPKVVAPHMYMKKNLDRYGHLLSMSPLRTLDDKASFFEWSSASKGEQVDPLIQRKHGVYMINANKHSFVKGEQYSFRRQVVRTCHRRNVAFDLWGEGWDVSQFRNAKRILKAFVSCVSSGNVPVVGSLKAISVAPLKPVGRTDLKLDIASRYKIALVIENQLDYVSEKIFDALDCGNVVVYVGPSLSLFDMQGAAIEVCNSETAVVEELDKLLRMSNSQLEEIRSGQLRRLTQYRHSHDFDIQLRSLASMIAGKLLGD